MMLRLSKRLKYLDPNAFPQFQTNYRREATSAHVPHDSRCRQTATLQA
jgi:hypothetical protein